MTRTSLAKTLRLCRREQHRHPDGPLLVRSSGTLGCRHGLAEALLPGDGRVFLLPRHQFERGELVGRGAVVGIGTTGSALPDEAVERKNAVAAPKAGDFGDEASREAAARAGRRHEVGLHGSPLVEADDDDACALDEADPEVSTVPEFGREHPDDAALGRARLLGTKQVVGCELSELEPEVERGPFEVTKPVDGVGADLDPSVGHRQPEAGEECVDDG